MGEGGLAILAESCHGKMTAVSFLTTPFLGTRPAARIRMVEPRSAPVKSIGPDHRRLPSWKHKRPSPALYLEKYI